ncbi:hypothetical protein BZG35_08315 [Brevundimonas sp. LM2]|uniref:M56 family metallopeptidase n=1 Tax=Brevundimonas sp. LM2 TaxID=1938605 RepID=UPI0009839149|nr:M56 family metallopeptidase [Brevundimonas sp. LM2]AQR61653.1 hypothetical protein BZG35_08315 [Brevundimonas sp. LM2]
MSPEFALDLAWKSAVLAGLILIATLLLRGRRAADQAQLLRLGAALLLAWPGLALLLPPLSLPFGLQGLVDLVTWGGDPSPGPAAPLQNPGIVVHATAVAARDSGWPPILPGSGDPQMLWQGLGIVYSLGVAILIVRLAVGVAVLSVWTRRGEAVTDPVWTEALTRQLNGRGRPRLVAAQRARGPLSWGPGRGVILLSPADITRPDAAACADAVLAHELAHLSRRDWGWLVVSRLATAVYWFNPLVWSLAQRLADRSEEAADALATHRIDVPTYARVLATFADRPGARVPAAALGPPARALSRRISRLLAGSPRRPGDRSLLTMVSLGCVGLAVCLSTLVLGDPSANALTPASFVRTPITSGGGVDTVITVQTPGRSPTLRPVTLPATAEAAAQPEPVVNAAAEPRMDPPADDADRLEEELDRRERAQERLDDEADRRADDADRRLHRIAETAGAIADIEGTAQEFDATADEIEREIAVEPSISAGRRSRMASRVPGLRARAADLRDQAAALRRDLVQLESPPTATPVVRSIPTRAVIPAPSGILVAPG